jgi:para-nitrobenzyl esterase
MYTDGIDYWPIVDGVVLPDEPAKLLDAGKFSHTPLIIGTTVDEATVFASALPIKTASAWRAHIAARHPGAESTAVAAYAAPNDADVRPAAIRWVNDWYFHGTARAAARAIAVRGVPVFLYSFSRVPPAQPLRAGAGAFHTAEMEYVFANPLPPWGKPEQFEAVDRSLMHAMSGAWMQFAQTGTPNGSELPVWPRYERVSDQHLDFGLEIRSGTGLHAQSLDTFDRIFAEMRDADRRVRTLRYR